MTHPATTPRYYTPTGIRVPYGASDVHYYVDPPIDGHDYVIVCDVDLMSCVRRGLYTSESYGDVCAWMSMDALPAIDPSAVLRLAGYVEAPDVDQSVPITDEVTR